MQSTVWRLTKLVELEEPQAAPDTAMLAQQWIGGIAAFVRFGLR
jgi:hypothetical protein